MILVSLFTICFVVQVVLGLIYGYRRYYVPPPGRCESRVPASCESYTRENITCPSDTIDNDTYQYVALKDCWANLTDGAENRYQLKNEIGNAYSKTWDKIYPEICDEV